MKNSKLIQSLLNVLLIFLPLYSLVAIDTNDHCDYSNVSPCLLEKLVDPATCAANKVGDPFIYSDDCEIGIARYLSRAVNMQNMIELNIDEGHDDCAAGENCVPPYNECQDYFCEKSYCESIEMLVEINAQFLAAAAYPWYDERDFAPGLDNYEASQQLICDINAAYDCAGLPRPIVQASIYVSMGDPAKVDLIKIPAEVLDFAMHSGLLSPQEIEYYSSGGEDCNEIDPAPNFCPDRMLTNGKTDIRNIETKLWVLYQAMSFIDMGYTSFHMGIYYDYASEEGGYQQLYELLQSIRNYAEKEGSFVIMNGENPMPPVDGGNSATAINEDGESVLLFDFDGRAMRPFELTDDPSITPDGDCGDAGQKNVDFQNSPCNNDEYMATISCCTTNSFGGTGGGLSPLGCYYESVPYFIYFDYSQGLEVHPFEDCSDLEIKWDEIGVASNGRDSKTWGYDDARWFSTVISKPCQEYWWDRMYCSVQDCNNSYGYLQIPGMLTIKYIENYCVDGAPNPNRPNADGYFLLKDNPSFTRTVKDRLDPLVPNIIFSEFCPQFVSPEPLYECNGETAPLGQCFTDSGVKKYTIKVGNADCASIYSIHVQKPEGTWLPQVKSTERTFSVNEEGIYTVTIRQDNLGILENHGVRTVVREFFLEPKCCDLLDSRECESMNDPFTGKSLSRKQDLIKIWPNPVRDNINVYVASKLLNIKIELYNINGVMVVSKEGLKGIDARLDVSELPNGVYHLSIVSDNQRTSKRILVN